MAVIGEDGEHHLHPCLVHDPTFPSSLIMSLICPDLHFLLGKWNGGADEGEGSPHIRCRPIKQRLVDLVTFS